VATPVSVPALPNAVPSVWRAISSLRIVRRLLGVSEEEPASPGAARKPVGLGLDTTDWDGPDTSLTQAELEVLK
jgi:hypothetical protein